MESGNTKTLEAIMATLANSLNNLSKSNSVEKPPLISKSVTAEQNIEQVDKYLQFIATSSSDKAFVLKQSLTDDIKYEIIFAPSYQTSCNDFSCLWKNWNTVAKEEK